MNLSGSTSLVSPLGPTSLSITSLDSALDLTSSSDTSLVSALGATYGPLVMDIPGPRNGCPWSEGGWKNAGLERVELDLAYYLMEHPEGLGSVAVDYFDSHRAGVAANRRDLLPLPLPELPAEGTVAVGGKLLIPSLRIEMEL